jgi:hypothetical protein
VLAAVLTVAAADNEKGRSQLETYAAAEAATGNGMLFGHLDILFFRILAQITAERTRFVAAMPYR